MRKILLVLIVVAACGNEQDNEVELTPCEQLREHLIDIRLADAVNVDKESHREAMRQALGRDFLSRCSQLGDAAVTCALVAPDSASAAACSTH